MPAYLNGGSSAFSTAITTLNTSGVDRYLLLHAAASSSVAMNVSIDAGSSVNRIIATYALVPANEVRDFGPYFIPAAYGFRAYTYSPVLGSYFIDEERP